MDPLIGQTINQKFVIHRLLGEGGMGKVYEGEQLGIGRRVAIKVLQESLSKIPAVSARFEREAAATGRVTHPNSVTIFDFGRDPQGRLYLAMEYLEGEALSARLKREQRLSASLAVQFISQLLETLESCHTSGVVHRDLKPDNIFICPQQNQEVIKILDYGIARLADAPEVTKTGQLIGTPHYMSPEQATGKKVTATTDIYAVGVIFFEMLVGQPPYTDKSNLELFRKHLMAPIPSLQERAPDRRELIHFEAIIQKSMAKNPAERFTSAKELRTIIQRAAFDLRAGKYSALWDVNPTKIASTNTLVTQTKSDAHNDFSSKETQALLDENGDQVATIADAERGPGTLELSETMAGEAELLQETQRVEDELNISDVEATLAMSKISPLLELEELAHADTAIAPAPSPRAMPKVVLDPSKIKRTNSSPDSAKIAAMIAKPVVPLDQALTPKLPRLEDQAPPKIIEPPNEESLPFFTAPSQPKLVLPDEPTPQRPAPSRWPLFAAIPIFGLALAVFFWPTPKPSSILLQTNPPGAKILLNGVERSGTSPMQLEVPKGKLALEAQKTGCTTLKQELMIEANTSQIILALTCP